VHVVALTVQLHQHRLKIAADLGEDMPETLNRLAVEEAATVLGHKDQMDVPCENGVSAVS
jgi:DNA repair ATPase RecN